jgi:hypothetical protein
MRIDLHVHGVGAQGDAILAKLDEILAKENAMAGELATLQTEVEETKTIMGSAIVLIQGLKAALDAAGSDPAALAALSAELDAKQQELAAAITANTPTPPTP